jgi:hypothetical protein
MKIIRFLLDNVRALLEDKIITYRIERKKSRSGELGVIDKRLKVLDSNLQKLMDRYYNNKIRQEHYDRDYTKFNVEYDELLKKKEIIESNVATFNTSFYEDFLKQDFESLYDALDDIEKRRLWLSVIKEIRPSRNGYEVLFH